MAIAHQIFTEKHGGTMEVRSKLGQGTEFNIHLPAKPAGYTYICMRNLFRKGWGGWGGWEAAIGEMSA